MVKKRITIDVLTPKQALLFGKVKERLEKKGCETYIISREYIELTNIFKLSRIKPIIIGRHGGRDLYNKLVSSLERTLMLSKILRKLSPDTVLSFSSPEAARASFGLNIPHISVNDSPHSLYVAKLTIPLSRKLLTPRIVGKKAWLDYGISKENIVTYNSLDPVAWLRDFAPNKNVLRKYDLSEGEYIVYRPEEYEASYLDSKNLTLETVSKVYFREKSLRSMKLVIVPRYERKTYQKILRDGDAVILEHGEDTRSVLFYSKCFIGAGGTMSTEAVLMGVPAISLYPSSTIVENFLIEKGLLIKAVDERGLRRWLEKIVSAEFDKDKRFSSLMRLRKMEDPAEKIAETCLNLS
ncbi:MAG: DUF354 domain-containing protein [Candidatus Brockarchaeota archaeon]|nr:DUF354 domain-containing protein [Candidatus Brockarchaeota archaeon]